MKLELYSNSLVQTVMSFPTQYYLMSIFLVRIIHSVFEVYCAT